MRTAVPASSKRGVRSPADSVTKRIGWADPALVQAVDQEWTAQHVQVEGPGLIQRTEFLRRCPNHGAETGFDSAGAITESQLASAAEHAILVVLEIADAAAVVFSADCAGVRCRPWLLRLRAKSTSSLTRPAAAWGATDRKRAASTLSALASNGRAESTSLLSNKVPNAP